MQQKRCRVRETVEDETLANQGATGMDSGLRPQGDNWNFPMGQQSLSYTLHLQGPLDQRH